MGDAGRVAGRAALDEMGRAVAAMLAAVGRDLPADDPPPVLRAVVPERSPDLPDLAELEAALGEANAGWVEWRRQLDRLVGAATGRELHLPP